VIAEQATELSYSPLLGNQLDPTAAVIAPGANDIGLLMTGKYRFA
jgi:hypothetical protein